MTKTESELSIIRQPHWIMMNFHACLSSLPPLRVLEQLRSLVAMNESLKRQEMQFKAHCREEKARLEGEIERLRLAVGQGTTEEQERVANIMRHYEADKERMQKIRALLVSPSPFLFYRIPIRIRKATHT